MRGFEGFLFDVLMPTLFVALFGLAIASAFRRHRRESTLSPESPEAPSAGTIKGLVKLGAVFVWMILMLFVVYRDLRIHYDLWVLQPKNVREITVGEHRFTDQSSITQIVTTLKSSEWYSVNHGGWGDETPIVLRTMPGTEWQIRAGYHFAQHGAVVLRYSDSLGGRWELGQVFSPTLPKVLEQLGVPLSHCDTRHGLPCSTTQTSSH
jgi:hypothetical protein